MEQATGRGIDGWVRNRGDGSVEAVFSGPQEVVRQMLEACRRGPPAARVEAVEEQGETDPVAPGFAQWPSL